MNFEKKKSKVVWFTGLSGVGKSTLSNYLFDQLKKNYRVMKIDGDTFRKKNNTKKNFSKKEIIKNNREIIKVIAKFQTKYDFILVSVISPLLQTRKYAKNKFKDEYYEINVFCKIKTLIKRDTKGLYKKAIEKKLNNLVGFKSKIRYQKSTHGVTKINTDKLTIKNATSIILKKINKIA
jgi:adenylylsulfate kinase-like enzyme